ncbi:MAG TPA: lipoyl synthase [Dehalococcoidia bacterium]|jgi:lipoic acid synthetase|nr:lipoyl synthase [Dehalococcoidia bacterium]
MSGEALTVSGQKSGRLTGKRPPWLKVRFRPGTTYQAVENLVHGSSLHTVCEEARCPNIGECWSRGTATFMILGDICTRSCGFCAVKTGRPEEFDTAEPRRVGATVARMNLRHAVVTSVNRDELADGGASIFTDSIRWIRRLSPGTTIEVLIPDFKGDERALTTVLDGAPEILNHNVETVPRLYERVRPQAIYQRSLEVLLFASSHQSGESMTKSGLMVGLGESFPEVIATLRDLRSHEVDIVTVGQYLRPTPKHLPIERYWHPDEFARLREAALAMGFSHVEAGPLVRSSYHADEQALSAASRGAGDDLLPLVVLDKSGAP